MIRGRVGGWGGVGKRSGTGGLGWGSGGRSGGGVRGGWQVETSKWKGACRQFWEETLRGRSFYEYGRTSLGVFARRFSRLAWCVLLSTTVRVIIMVKILRAHEAQPSESTTNFDQRHWKRRCVQHFLEFYGQRQIARSDCEISSNCGKNFTYRNSRAFRRGFCRPLGLFVGPYPDSQLLLQKSVKRLFRV